MLRASLITLLALCSLQTAQARVRWVTPGSYRLQTVALGDLRLDSDDNETGQNFYGMHRLRIDPIFEAGRLKVEVQIDVLTGQIFGQTNSIGADYVERRYGDPENSTIGWTTVEPRLGWAELDFDWIAITAGQVGAQFGLGLVDADGFDHPEDDDRLFERFNRRRAGDLLQRFELALRPFRMNSLGALADLEIAIGGDHIYQDDLATWFDNDSAWRLYGAVNYRGEELSLGGQFTYRTQTDRDGDFLDSWTTDLYARWDRPLYTIGADLHLEGEAALVLGHSDRWRNASHPEEVDLLGIGGVARAEIAWRCPRIHLGIEMGYASGDGDPDDSQMRQFRFDPDHRVGFILFSDALRLIFLRSAERQADTTLNAVPPAGLEELPTDGAVQNAIYFFPGVTWRPGNWKLTLAALVAWADTPLTDPTETFLAGGSPRNHLGLKADRFYGTEYMASIHHSWSLSTAGQFTAGIQTGILLPGSAITETYGKKPLPKLVGEIEWQW